MNNKILVNITTATVLILASLQVQAGATAMARVTANIVPAVSASVSGSVVLQTVKQGHKQSTVLAGSSISMSTPAAGDPAKFNIRNRGNFDYVVTVSPVITAAQNASANAVQLNNTRLSTAGRSIKGDDQQELKMDASLTTSSEKGAYNGSVYITANFN